MKRIWGWIEHGSGKHQSNMVWDISQESPTITTLDGGTQQIKILVRVKSESVLSYTKENGIRKENQKSV